MESFERNLRKRFVLDTDAPIQVLEDPYFDHFVKLYDSYRGGLLGKLEQFSQTVLALGGSEPFLKKFSELRDQMVVHIRSKEAFALLMKAQKRNLLPIKPFKLYHPNNHEGCFISVDINTADFRSLQCFNNSLVDGCKTYQEFVARFTSLPHFQQSRDLRHGVFLCVNPEFQHHLMLWMIQEMQHVLRALLPPDCMFVFSDDELLISIDRFGVDVLEPVKALLSERVQLGQLPIDDFVSVRQFTLKRIGNHPYYVREYDDGEFVLKQVPRHFFAQVFKHYLGLPVEKLDLAFYFEGHLAELSASVIEERVEQ